MQNTYFTPGPFAGSRSDVYEFIRKFYR